MAELKPHERLRETEVDIKKLERRKAELEYINQKLNLFSYKVELNKITEQLARQEKNKEDVLSQIQYSLEL